MIYDTLLELSRKVYEQDTTIANAFCYTTEELDAALCAVQEEIDRLEFVVLNKANSLPATQKGVLLSSLHAFR